MESGVIKTLFTSVEKDEALFPRTKTRAVSDDNGVGLDVLLDEMNYNISNKAPAGYGLGEDNGMPCYDTNTAIKIGFYRLCGEQTLNPPPDLFAWGTMLVEKREIFIYQTVKTADGYSNQYTITRYSRDMGSTWSEWEYLNPPMMEGVEYRTTERYGGHPVYVQRVIVNSIPTGTLITLVPESTSLVRFECKIQQYAGLHEIWSPFFYGSIDSAYSAFAYAYKEMTGAIRCNFNCGANIDVDAAAYVTIWYTKD